LILSSYEIDIFIDPNNEISTIKTDIIKDEGEKRIILGIPFVKIKSYEGKKSFLISEFEISYSQFAEFIKKTKYKPNGKWDLYYINDSYGNYPVIDVNFEDALAFSNYLSNETGLSISLPTFEQWKRAAGADKTNYTWGNEWDLEATNSNLNNFNGELQINGNKGTLQSITFLKDISIYGVKHLNGNVKEWCLDEKKGGDKRRLAAGGSWKITRENEMRSNVFYYARITTLSDDLGFRVVINGN